MKACDQFHKEHDTKYQADDAILMIPHFKVHDV